MEDKWRIKRNRTPWRSFFCSRCFREITDNISDSEVSLLPRDSGDTLPSPPATPSIMGKMIHPFDACEVTHMSWNMNTSRAVVNNIYTTDGWFYFPEQTSKSDELSGRRYYCLTSFLVGIKPCWAERRVMLSALTATQRTRTRRELETAQSECKYMRAPNVKWHLDWNTIWTCLPSWIILWVHLSAGLRSWLAVYRVGSG